MRADHRTRATRRARGSAWLGACLCVALLVGLSGAAREREDDDHDRRDPEEVGPAARSRSPTRSPSSGAWSSITRSPPSSSTTPRSRSGWRSTRASSARPTRQTSSDRRASFAPSGSSVPTSTSLDATSSLQTSGVLAYYSPKTKKITVKGTSTDDISTRVTVAHELTHALQDQHFDLRKLEKDAAKAHASTPAAHPDRGRRGAHPERVRAVAPDAGSDRVRRAARASRRGRRRPRSPPRVCPNRSPCSSRRPTTSGPRCSPR